MKIINDSCDSNASEHSYKNPPNLPLIEMQKKRSLDTNMDIVNSREQQFELVSLHVKIEDSQVEVDPIINKEDKSKSLSLFGRNKTGKVLRYTKENETDLENLDSQLNPNPGELF